MFIPYLFSLLRALIDAAPPSERGAVRAEIRDSVEREVEDMREKLRTMVPTGLNSPEGTEGIDWMEVREGDVEDHRSATAKRLLPSETFSSRDRLVGFTPEPPTYGEAMVERARVMGGDLAAENEEVEQRRLLEENRVLLADLRRISDEGKEEKKQKKKKKNGSMNGEEGVDGGGGGEAEVATLDPDFLGMWLDQKFGGDGEGDDDDEGDGGGGKKEGQYKPRIFVA